MLSQKGLDHAIARLSLMKFFPSDATFRAALMEELARLSALDSRLEWLVTRMNQLYAEWPGVQEMRAVYCSRFIPAADGFEADSQVYADGIPSENPQQAPALPAPRSREISADPELAKAVNGWVEKTGLPSVRPRSCEAGERMSAKKKQAETPIPEGLSAPLGCEKCEGTGRVYTTKTVKDVITGNPIEVDCQANCDCELGKFLSASRKSA